jgi:opacity protein-like surface antigen
MNKRILSGGFICGVLLYLLFLSALSWGQTTRIKVIVENATIRSGPGLESEIISDKVVVGTEFEAEKMVGDWYEIRYRNTLGLLVTGYIHKMYVEKAEPKLTPKVEEPMKPTAPPAPVPRQAEPSKKALPKGDFAILGGFVSGSFLSETSTYSASWNEGGLKSVIESGSIGHKIGSSAGLGLSFSYLFAGGLGIQVRYDFNLGQNLASGSQSTYAIAWEWTTAGAGARDDAYPTTGRFSLSPLSLNVIYKIAGRSAFTPYLSGGVSYLLGKVEAETMRGYGHTWQDESYQYIDWIDIPLAVDKSIGDLGFNVGAGFDFRLASRMAITAEAVYFIGKTTQEPWRPLPGTYPKNNFPNLTWTLDQSFADQIADQVTPLEIKTSFFKVQLGIKFLF